MNESKIDVSKCSDRELIYLYFLHGCSSVSSFRDNLAVEELSSDVRFGLERFCRAYS